MAALFSGWLHTIHGHGPAKLPRKRKFLLTPTSSQADLSSPSAPPAPPPPGPRDGAAHSPFFQRLPLEVRIQILTVALGRRTLHMDLVLSHPPLAPPPPHRVKAFLGHAGLYVEPGRADDAPLYPVLDTSTPQHWYWLGSVCHRNPPGVDASGRQSVQPCQDQCRDGITLDHACSLWPGQSPDKCRVGAMGWLRACRQAYAEGIEILYSKNTMHTCSKPLILHADRLLLPQRLAAITSLELQWDFGSRPPWAESFASKVHEDMVEFDGMLRTVLTSFRGLRSLHISVQWTGRAPLPAHGRGAAGGPPAEAMILRRVDAMVRQMPAHVAAFTLALPSSVYQDRRDEAEQRSGGLVEHVSPGAGRERFWRPVQGGVAHAGYWVCLGQQDTAAV